MKKKIEFKVGNAVEWESQSKGYSKLKTGHIAHVIPADMEFPHVEGLLRSAGAEFHSTYGGGSARKEESYAVLVSPGEGYMLQLYWPRTSALRLSKLRKQTGESTGEIVLSIVAFFIVLLCVFAFNSCECHIKSRAMGFKSDYGPVQGCMIEPKPGIKVPFKSYRYMGD